MSIQNMKRSETTEQIALFNWAKRTESILPELALMYHVPNEGKRSNGGILKAAGLKSGVPDICLPVANNGFHGLYIELKFGKNKANITLNLDNLEYVCEDCHNKEHKAVHTPMRYQYDANGNLLPPKENNKSDHTPGVQNLTPGKRTEGVTSKKLRKVARI